jgi:hypothetical protein
MTRIGLVIAGCLLVFGPVSFVSAADHSAEIRQIQEEYERIEARQTPLLSVGPLWDLLVRTERLLQDETVRGGDRVDAAYLLGKIAGAHGRASRRVPAQVRTDVPTDAEASPGIRAKCAQEWPGDYRMRLYCEKSQLEALRQLRGTR